MKLKICDYILITAIVLSAIVLSIPKHADNSLVLLEIDGKVIKTFNLDTDTEFLYTDKYTNLIAVDNGEIFIKSSNCPDKTCMHSGCLKKGNGSKIICCLPNKLILRTASNHMNTDVISG